MVVAASSAKHWSSIQVTRTVARPSTRPGPGPPPSRRCPGNRVARGQLAQFDSNAGAYGDAVPSAQQSFADMPYSNAFWLYVERSYLHAVIGGYTGSPPCTTGVPCFLPANAVTRG